MWVTIGTITIVGVYFSPNRNGQAFLRMVEKLKDALKNLPGDLIVAGDSNSRAIERGMPRTNSRGRHLLKMGARLDLTVANLGQTMIYRRPGFGYSIPFWQIVFIHASDGGG